MRIGILGLTTKSGNKGCEALAYSFFEIINRIAEKHEDKIDIIMIDNSNLIQRLKSVILWFLGRTPERFLYAQSLYKNIRFRVGKYHIKNGKYFFSYPIRTCDYIFDFTAGDSFTDIYGSERFWNRTKLKNALEESGAKLILGSQTIGPFIDSKSEDYAAFVIKKCHAIFVRDKMSFDYTLQFSGREPILTTDVAFVLPYKKGKTDSEKKKIGFNPSGLLWAGGYTMNNQFGLSVDYRTYCQKVLEWLIEKGYEIYLIGHAFYENRPDLPDNDSNAINALKELIPQLRVAPFFKTPMEIKSFISSMSLFIGARMHATIGALSAGIPVIPFSYSRKFEGLFESLEYTYLINGCNETTDEAIENTINMVYRMDVLEKSVRHSQTIISEKINSMFESYEAIIYKTNG